MRRRGSEAVRVHTYLKQKCGRRWRGETRIEEIDEKNRWGKQQRPFRKRR
jgi:hypothetical protein